MGAASAALFLCTRAPKGRMSAELTGARRAEQGKRFPLLDSERVSVTGRVSRFLFFHIFFPYFPERIQQELLHMEQEV